MTVEALLPRDFYQLRIKTISAKGLTKVNLLSTKIKTSATVSIEGDKKIGKQTTPINEKGGTNPTWSNELTFLVKKIDVHGDFLTVVVEIHGSIFQCVGEVRIKDMMRHNIMAGVATLDIRKSTLQFTKPKQIITISYEIKEIADLQMGHMTSILDELVFAYNPAAVVPLEAGSVSGRLDELVTPPLDVAPTGFGPANPPMTSNYSPQGAPATASPGVQPGHNSTFPPAGAFPQGALVTGFPAGNPQPGAFAQGYNSQPGLYPQVAAFTAFPAGYSPSPAFPQAFPAGYSQSSGAYLPGGHGFLPHQLEFPPHHPGHSFQPHPLQNNSAGTGSLGSGVLAHVAGMAITGTISDLIQGDGFSDLGFF